MSTAKSTSKTPEKTLTTGIHLPRSLHNLIRQIALKRAEQYGGRASVSALIVGLIEKHRKELEKELAAASR